MLLAQLKPKVVSQPRIRGHLQPDSRGLAPLEHERGFDPRMVSRIGGALMLVVIALGAFGATVVQPGLVVPGDPAATAADVQSLSRLGIAAALAVLACGVALALILNFLLRPVSKNLAGFAAVLILAGITAEVVAALNALGALSLLGHDTNVAALEPGRDHNMTTVAGGALGFNIALAFLGSSDLVLAYLIIRSGYLPRTLGALILVGGLGYLLKSSTAFLAPDLSHVIFPAIMAPGFFGELSLGLWLAVNGVDMQAWTRVRAHMRPHL